VAEVDGTDGGREQALDQPIQTVTGVGYRLAERG
jgi:hypothetical protein